MASLKFTKLPSPGLPRSSHTLSLIGGFAYIFGGEIQPRQPVDSAVHRFDIKTGQYDEIRGEGDVPAPRVGHAAATIADDIYIFGGRGGPDMAPLEENGAVYRFSPSTSLWTCLTPPAGTSYPSARSYHCATATKTHLYIHAGCAAQGRLNDLWAFDLTSSTWTQLPDAPGAPRGGAALAHLGGKVYRMGGFNGKTEVGGGIDVFTVSSGSSSTADGLDGQWETISYDSAEGLARGQEGDLKSGEAGPGARSVTALLPLGDKLLSIMGEGKPSPTGGHDAAGNFWDDVWSFDPKGKRWQKAEVGGPEARGWFAADSDGERAVLWGGLNGANERLGDGWVLQ